jgi:phosphodiesterase/alkaline phosphatase D-like protein
VKAVVLTVGIAFVVSSLIASTTAAQPGPAEKGKGLERRQIITGPALESATHDRAIIRWTANTKGGTTKHYGIVRYGTAPTSLDHTARSANRWNANLPDMTYRVQIDGLTPTTTYYYTVDAAQADGVGMGLKNAVNQFTTRPRP